MPPFLLLSSESEKVVPPLLGEKALRSFESLLENKGVAAKEKGIRSQVRELPAKT